jgi:quinol monooxygenase YgiN
MHAIVVHVTIKQGRDEDAEKELETIVVPMAKAAPGFQGAHWARELGRQCGISIELYDSKEHAEEELARRSDGPPPDAAVTVDSASVFEVLASA